jgi:hypothetical protein
MHRNGYKKNASYESRFVNKMGGKGKASDFMPELNVKLIFEKGSVRK